MADTDTPIKSLTERADGLLKPLLTAATLLATFAAAVGLLLTFYYTQREGLPFEVAAFPASYAISAAATGLLVIALPLSASVYPLLAISVFPTLAEEKYEINPSVRRIVRLKAFALVDVPAQIAAGLWVIGVEGSHLLAPCATVLLTTVLRVSMYSKRRDETFVAAALSQPQPSIRQQAARYMGIWLGFVGRAVWSGLCFTLLLLLLTLYLRPLVGPAFTPLAAAALLFVHECLITMFVDLANPRTTRALVSLSIFFTICAVVHPDAGGYVGMHALRTMKGGGGYAATLGISDKGCQAIPVRFKKKDFDCSEIPVLVWLKDAGHLYVSMQDQDRQHVRWSIKRDEVLIEVYDEDNARN